MGQRLEGEVSPLLEGPPTAWRRQVALWVSLPRDPIAGGRLRLKEERRENSSGPSPSVDPTLLGSQPLWIRGVFAGGGWGGWGEGVASHGAPWWRQ